MLLLDILPRRYTTLFNKLRSLTSKLQRTASSIGFIKYMSCFQINYFWWFIMLLLNDQNQNHTIRINVSQKNCRTNQEALRNTIFNCIFLQILTIQKSSDSPITDKWWHNAKYKTLNFIRLDLVKNNSMPNSDKPWTYQVLHLE